MFQKNITNGNLIMEYGYGIKEIIIKSDRLPKNGKVSFPIKDHGFNDYGQIIYKPGHTIHYLPTQGINSINHHKSVVVYEFPWFRFRKSFLIEISNATIIHFQPYKECPFDISGPLVLFGSECEFKGIHSYMMDIRYIMNDLTIKLDTDNPPKNYFKHIIIEGIQDFIIFYLQNNICFYHANDMKQIGYFIDSKRFQSLTIEMTEKYISNNISITQDFNNMVIKFQDKFIFTHLFHRYNVVKDILRIIIQPIITKIQSISQSLWFHLININTNDKYQSYIKEYKYKIINLLKSYNIHFDLSKDNIYYIIPNEYLSISSTIIYPIVNEYNSSNDIIKTIIKYILYNKSILNDELIDICNNYLKNHLYLYQDLKDDNTSIRWKDDNQIFKFIDLSMKHNLDLDKILICPYISDEQLYQSIMNQDDYIPYTININQYKEKTIYLYKNQPIITYKHDNDYFNIKFFIDNDQIVYQQILPGYYTNILSRIINQYQNSKYCQEKYFIYKDNIFLDNGILLPQNSNLNTILNNIPLHFNHIKEQLKDIFDHIHGIISITLKNLTKVYLININEYQSIIFNCDLPDYCSDKLIWYNEQDRKYIINQLTTHLQRIFPNSSISISDDTEDICEENYEINSYFASCKVDESKLAIVRLPLETEDLYNKFNIFIDTLYNDIDIETDNDDTYIYFDINFISYDDDNHFNHIISFKLIKIFDNYYLILP